MREELMGVPVVWLKPVIENRCTVDLSICWLVAAATWRQLCGNKLADG